MHQERANSRVIDLAAYRQTRQGGNREALSQGVLTNAEEAIEEIAKHLLSAIRIVTARYRHEH